MNHKGLVTFDRKTRKDSFYAYKAWWSKEPFVHLCGKRYVDRPESETMVKVYSNQPSVSLYVNGKLFSEQRGDKVFTFRIPLGEGETRLEVHSGELTDSAVLRRPTLWSSIKKARTGCDPGARRACCDLRPCAGKTKMKELELL